MKIQRVFFKKIDVTEKNQMENLVLKNSTYKMKKLHCMGFLAEWGCQRKSQ